MRNIINGNDYNVHNTVFMWSTRGYKMQLRNTLLVEFMTLLESKFFGFCMAVTHSFHEK